MIILAIIFHFFGRFLPCLITKKKINDLRVEFKWRQPFFELSGFAFDLLLAFIIVSATVLTNKVEYLPTENAIYGSEFSNELKDLGFKNGDKILTINGSEIEKFNELFYSIIITPGDLLVDVLRVDSIMSISITENDKIRLIKTSEITHISPRLAPNSVNKEHNNGLITKLETQGIDDVFRTYRMIFKQIGFIIFPNPAVEDMGFIVPNGASTARGWFFLFAIQLVIIGLVNVLPLPGLDLGNSILSAIDNLRQKKFNLQKLRMIRIICLVIVGIMLSILILI